MLRVESCECGPSGTDIFSKPPTQTAVISRTVVDCHPVADLGGLGPIEFYLPASDEDVYNLREHRLEVSLKVTKKDGSNLAADSKVSVVNYTLHSRFSQLDVWINEQLVSYQSNTYAYRAYIENHPTYGSAQKKAQLALAHYHRDKAINMDDSKGNANTGYQER